MTIHKCIECEYYSVNKQEGYIEGSICISKDCRMMESECTTNSQEMDIQYINEVTKEIIIPFNSKDIELKNRECVFFKSCNLYKSNTILHKIVKIENIAVNTTNLDKMTSMVTYRTCHIFGEPNMNGLLCKDEDVFFNEFTKLTENELLLLKEKELC
jgi:hypothetical protein